MIRPTKPIGNPALTKYHGWYMGIKDLGTFHGFRTFRIEGVFCREGDFPSNLPEKLITSIDISGDEMLLRYNDGLEETIPVEDDLFKSLRKVLMDRIEYMVDSYGQLCSGIHAHYKNLG